MRWLEKLLDSSSTNVEIRKGISLLVSSINPKSSHYNFTENYIHHMPSKVFDHRWATTLCPVNIPLSGRESTFLQHHNRSIRSSSGASFTSFRGIANSANGESSITREWLAQLWREELSKNKIRRRKRRTRNQEVVQYVEDSPASFRFLFFKPAEEYMKLERTTEQPPISQYDGDLLSPSSPEEVKLAPLLSRANLVIARDIEWANIMFAFEQESRYVIMDPYFHQSPVGFIREQSNVIFRQLLRARRPFVAYITDALGNEIFRVRRPFWWINSTIYAEVDGKEIGVVHRRWHLWRRIYDLYLGNKQFAVVENPGFWNWTFTLKDEDDNVLAQIDRNWRGIGFELFTDAGQYVIRFGAVGLERKSSLASPIEELEVVRPLTLSERAVAVALAVSLDSDYFSRRGGWGLPILIAGE
ncbi:altered inheritance rate of mitochondria protein 25 [Ananas comosus]|uniref:Phospholipid scramblase n=1 Tax=Ananas comosus TaxID=4615 RepID=A0A6P5FL15_ANACO|nr:altered inheritance rate of mitochondria protein 25 [Ananas comosus]XP_020093841.1 altered inheritance rate of mitochondria protein 25 [Ananas comosus]